MHHAKSDELLAGGTLSRFEGKVDLIFTSPPFPLNRKKRYGDEKGEEYVRWLCAFGPLFKKMLKPGGSIVIEMGNSWEPGEPVMSTLALRSLLDFQSNNALHLCQEFIGQNPAKLPSPAQWVNIKGVTTRLPNALISYDRFHVVTHLPISPFVPATDQSAGAIRHRV